MGKKIKSKFSNLSPLPTTSIEAVRVWRQSIHMMAAQFVVVWLLRWRATAELGGVFRLGLNRVHNVQRMSCRTKYSQDCGLKKNADWWPLLLTLMLEVFFCFFFFFFYWSWNQIAPHSWEHCISINSPCHHLLYFKVKNKTCRQYGHTALNPPDPLYSDRWRTEILRWD